MAYVSANTTLEPTPRHRPVLCRTIVVRAGAALLVLGCCACKRNVTAIDTAVAGNMARIKLEPTTTTAPAPSATTQETNHGADTNPARP
jgi:hypothetical protein